jgi:hypothetical protein
MDLARHAGGQRSCSTWSSTDRVSTALVSCWTTRTAWPSPDLCTTLNERIWGKGIAVLLERRSKLRSGSSAASGEGRRGLMLQRTLMAKGIVIEPHGHTDQVAFFWARRISTSLDAGRSVFLRTRQVFRERFSDSRLWLSGGDLSESDRCGSPPSLQPQFSRQLPSLHPSRWIHSMEAGCARPRHSPNVRFRTTRQDIFVKETAPLCI